MKECQYNKKDKKRTMPGAVSYTHLDVYKRQLIIFLISYLDTTVDL